jgi:CBS domain-containing protein
MIGADGAMCGEVTERIARCGYVAGVPSAGVGTLEEWSAKFSGWISSPVLSGAASALSYFDLFPVCGSEELWGRLKEGVEEETRAAEHFTMVMAHDCLDNLPPLTFFQELVVEESGEQTGVFRLEESALRPLVNVARVFGMEAGSVLGASSSDRFRAARLVAPEGEAILREAGEALRVVLSLQARAGLRQHDEGHEMPAARIDARERLALKRGFRSILNLLEFTEEFKWKGR